MHFTIRTLINRLEYMAKEYGDDLKVFIWNDEYDYCQLENSDIGVADVRKNFKSLMKDTPRHWTRIRQQLKKKYMRDYKYYGGNTFLFIS